MIGSAGPARDGLGHDDVRGFLAALFRAAVAAAHPGVAVPSHRPQRPRGRTIVVGAGKASAQMARAMEQDAPGVAALAADMDGVDGAETNAGAFAGATPPRRSVPPEWTRGRC